MILALVLCAAAAAAVGAAQGAGDAGHRNAHHPGVQAASAKLAKSTASSHHVQPQPPPGSCHAKGRGLYSLPDPHCTPGAIDPAVTQRNIGRTICHSGYTKTVRPPESITEPEKRASLKSYGDHRALHAYEYDHLVPLELGGARNDPRNLWPEPGASPNPKDSLEYRLRTRVCDGQMKLSAAQLAIAHNWVSAYHRYIG